MKQLGRWPIGYFVRHRKEFQLVVGDLINDCTGFNGEILEIEPSYFPFGKGELLFDIDFTTKNTGCSLIHCGIEPEIPRGKVEKHHLSYLMNWVFAEPGRKWFGEEFEERTKKLLLARQVLESGGHITDERGRLLDEFR